MTALALRYALRAIAYALEFVKTRYANRPLSMAVCDANRGLLNFAWMDDVKLLTIELIQHKVHASNRLGCTTQILLQHPQKERLDISYSANPRFTALLGGIPILYQGKCLEAVAVSDLSAQEDHGVTLFVAEILLKGIAQ